ncbi:hypothetical protein ACFL47_06400 [Candidatus Latescibacterota bacterium]
MIENNSGISLDQVQTEILKRGLDELLSMTDGLDFKLMPSEKYPYPLTMFAYETMPDPVDIRDAVRSRKDTDPVAALEQGLALFELHESNRKDIGAIVPDDHKFLGDCFNSKRANGWIAFLGNADRTKLEKIINDQWKFRFFIEGSPETGLYVLLNMLVRYAHVYGRMRDHENQDHSHKHDHGHSHFMDKQPPGEHIDKHDMTHFIDEICPGLMVCQGKMTDLELTLSLMAMKIGVPAIVPDDYPFSLGKTITVERYEDLVDVVTAFPNIRRLLDVPDIPKLPSYCKSEYSKTHFKPDVTWGKTGESFYFIRKGPVTSTGFGVKGQPGESLGIVITIDAEPMDAFDRTYIENTAVNYLAMMKDVSADREENRLIITLSKKAANEPERIGEVLLAGIKHEFPQLTNIHVDIIFDTATISKMTKVANKEIKQRADEILSTTEENIDRFYSCVGCSPFAPNHMCVLSPERPPQCGRPFAMIKTGALYAYDDMSNIHHNIQNRAINSFQAFDKGTIIDSETGEWSGVKEQIRRMTHGRTRRMLLHSLKENPHTGCGCFRLIVFETDQPYPGIGIMDRSFKGTCPDGRSWDELHYALGGKQAPGIAGAAPNYLTSPKFLQADGGWGKVVWVSPGIAKTMGDRLPSSVIIGEDEEMLE